MKRVYKGAYFFPRTRYGIKLLDFKILFTWMYEYWKLIQLYFNSNENKIKCEFIF